MSNEGQGQGNEGGAGNEGQPWFAGFQNAEAKSFVETKGFKDPESLVTSYANMEKLIGADRAGRTVVLPKDDKDVDGLKAFRTKMGVPETPDTYQLPVPEGQDPTFSKAAANWFHARGVPPQAAREIVGDFNKHIGDMVKAQELAAQTESARELEAVKGEWGSNFDANAEVARRYLKATGLTPEQMSAVEGALGTAAFLKTFHTMGKGLGEAVFAGGDGGGFGGDKSGVSKLIDDLRQRRMENKISQDDYLAEMDRLQKIKAA
jgi:hypothetical protein